MISFRAINFWLHRHHVTLELIFKEPPPDISWQALQSLLIACDVDLRPGAGNGTRIRFNDSVVEISHPEPGRPTAAPTIRKMRSFLKKAGITPTAIWQLL